MKSSSDIMQLALAAHQGQRAATDPAEIVLKSAAGPDLLPASREVSVRDVARVAKVSPATVSLVINENPRISPSTQQRVRQAMDQLGYRPNRLAQNLSRRDTRMLAVLLPSLGHAFADRYFGELMSGIFDRARSLGFKVMLEQTTPEFIAERRHLELFERRFVDGVLCLGNSDNHPFLTDFGAVKCPLLVVNNYFPQWPDLDCVVCDYRGGAEQVMNYLQQLGHRRIGLIRGSGRVQTARDVISVWEQALKNSGVDPVPVTWCEDGKFTEAGGAEAAMQLMRNHPDLTAIVASNDKMAIGALHYLNSAEKRVPQDVSVVGFDDMEHAAFVNPALTTVHLLLYEAGVLACEKLVRRIQGGAGEPMRAVLPTHLIVRNSTGMAKA